MEHFVAGMTARTAAALVGVNRNMITKFYHNLRIIIARNAEDTSPFYNDPIKSDNFPREAFGKYITFYTNSRLHQALGYKTPNSVYYVNIKISQTLKDQSNKSQINYINEGDEYSQIQQNFLS